MIGVSVTQLRDQIQLREKLNQHPPMTAIFHRHVEPPGVMSSGGGLMTGLIGEEKERQDTHK